jgi:hypothetical protein
MTPFQSGDRVRRVDGRFASLVATVMTAHYDAEGHSKIVVRFGDGMTRAYTHSKLILESEYVIPKTVQQKFAWCGGKDVKK